MANSPGDYPLVQLRSIESGQTAFVPVVSWSTNSFISAPVLGFAPGYTLATVFVNGIPSQSALLLIGNGTAIVSLGNLAQTYDGTPRNVSVVTVPSGLTVDLTYNGSSNAPITVGSYTVVGIVNDLNYVGSATNILVVSYPTAVPFSLTGASLFTGGFFELSFSNTPGVSFTVLSTTNLALPLNQWTLVGGVAEVARGQYLFIDYLDPLGPKRFYRVRSP